MADTFTKVGLIIVIILLVVIIGTLSGYVVKIEPITTTTTMVTTRPMTTSVPPTTVIITTTLPETTTTSFDCSKASFKFIEGSYSLSTSQLTMKLENTGDVDLTMEYIFFTYPNDVVMRERISGLIEGRVLERHNTRSFLTSQIEDGFLSGRITTNCPNVTVDFTYSDVT